MKIVTFNVNGLRSIREYFKVSSGWSFDQFLESLGADIVCLQETKINEASKLEREYALPADYTGYYAFQRGVKKIGYSGVATLCRTPWRPLEYEDGFTGAYEDHSVGPRSFASAEDEELRRLDGEGRCVITDHGQFVLLNVYFPNDSGPERAAYRVNFYSRLFERCQLLLEAGRSLVIVGDFNVTWHPMDHCDYAGAYREVLQRIGSQAAADLVHRIALGQEVDDPNDAFSIKMFFEMEGKELRRWFYQLLHTSHLAAQFGLRDAYRQLHEDEFERYTCWSTLVSARGTNHGTRLDSILVAGPLFQNGTAMISACDIIPDFMGSDHCPVYVELLALSHSSSAAPALPRNLVSHHKQRTLSDFFNQQPRKEEASTIASNIPVTKKSKTNKKGAKATANLTDFFAPLPKEETRIEMEDGGAYLDEESSCTASTSVSAVDWRDLFNKPRSAPLCRGHSEACKLLTVNKKGSNQGRKFYMCARGVGPKDDSQSRCSHFEWLNKSRR